MLKQVHSKLLGNEISFEQCEIIDPKNLLFFNCAWILGFIVTEKYIVNQRLEQFIKDYPITNI